MNLNNNQTAAVPKTAVIGAESFIGKHLLNEYRKHHLDSVGTSRSSVSEYLAYFDMLNPDITPLKLSASGHRAAVICTAVTRIDQCEKNKELTRKINVVHTIQLIHDLADLGIQPIFLSSDNVFDGTKNECYTEEDSPNPITEYGKQKFEVEREIRKSGKPHLIIRLSKVFGNKKKDNTFLIQEAEKLLEGKKIFAAHDLIFNPICVKDAVRAILAAQKKQLSGTLHICSPEVWSRYKLMVALCETLGCNQSLVKKISLDDLQGPILPKNVSMCCKKLKEKTKLSFTLISTCLEEIKREYRQGIKSSS